MPIYDYRCAACGHEVEVIHGIHDPGPSTCSVCGGQMRKALSPPAIHFRGGGWAKKDARAASAASSAKASTTASSGKDTGSSEGGDASASKGSAGDSASKTTAASTDGAGGNSKSATSAGGST